MKSHGEVIRQVRLNKGYSQKEIYTGIVSKSYAIEFEKGHHDMTISNFEKVLVRLYLTYEEFKFIQLEYQKSLLSDNYQLFMTASNKNDALALKKLLTTLTNFKDQDERLLIAQIRLTIIRIEFSKSPTKIVYPLSETRIISDFLLGVESWSLQEMNLFVNTLGFLPFETTEFLMTSTTKVLHKYKAHHAYSDLIAGLLVNFISFAISEKAFNSAKHYLELLKNTSLTLFEAWQREFYLFLDGIYKIVTGDASLGEKQCRYIIQHMGVLEQFERQSTFEKTLALYLNEQLEVEE